MKPQDAKERTSVHLFGLLRYLSGIIFGIGFGMLLTFMLIPEQYRTEFRKLLPDHFFVFGYAGIGLGLCIFSLAGWVRNKVSQTSEADV